VCFSKSRHDVYSWGEPETGINNAINYWFGGGGGYFQAMHGAYMSVLRHANSNWNGDVLMRKIQLKQMEMQQMAAGGEEGEEGEGGEEGEEGEEGEAGEEDYD
jgi:hypothetical protein